ncbi:hypothetical protein [Brevundimonas diminuta]|uniref:hypothetical protein n=1 Tax=Brevundimonas diminuta TaxID=293 RepID=UPI0032079F70
MTDQKTAGLDMDEAAIRRIVREEIAEVEAERSAVEDAAERQLETVLGSLGDD